MNRGQLIRRLLGVVIALAVVVFGGGELLEWSEPGDEQPAQENRAIGNQVNRNPVTEEGSTDLVEQDRYDLRADERRGGHTIERHVGKSESDLAERLRRQRDLRTASSFFDLATAETVVAATLRQNARRLENWLARSGNRPNLALDYTGQPDHVVGISLSRNRDAVQRCPNARVVLRSSRSGGSGAARAARAAHEYYVLTSYPSCR